MGLVPDSESHVCRDTSSTCYFYGDKCVTIEECFSDMGGLVYDAAGERLCLPDKAECRRRNGYVLEVHCLTGAQCGENNGYALSVIGLCVLKYGLCTDGNYL